MKSNCLAVIGMQYGDEGKGKFVEYIAKDYDYIVRYQGGDNAGHSIQFNKKRYSLRLLPSGIFYPTKTVVIGNGVVVNIETLLSEIEYLKKNKITMSKLCVSDCSHVVFDYHLKIDELNEKIKGSKKIGTTHRGIGPCYSDKINRIGIRICDLYNLNNLKNKIKVALLDKNILFKHFKLKKFDVNKTADKYFKLGKKIRPYVTNTTKLLNDAIKTNKSILFEGAQGGMLDIDFGTYPFVTSTSPLTSMYTGSGLELNKIDNVLGIIKSYLSRVGSGPMPTEIFGDLANDIREKGHEYGTVTKRPRRVGWLNLVSLKHTIQISGCKYIAVTLLDVLDELDKIKVCIGYKLNNSKINYVSFNDFNFEKCEPIYKVFKGWKKPIDCVKKYEELPSECKDYLSFIQSFLNVKIRFISVGPSKEQTIEVND